MRRIVFVSIVGLSLILQSCGGDVSDVVPSSAASADEAAVSTTATTMLATTTTAPPTTTTVPPTTTTTQPPTPQELRDEFLAALDAEGWRAYIDETVGWSVRYPGDWDVVTGEPGGLVAFSPPLGGGVLIVSPSLDATDADESSDDYLTGNVTFSVDDGLIREPQEDAWFWLDSDFDGVESPQDVAGVQLQLAADPATGKALGDDEVAPVWWYGYYDPQSRPSYGYVMQTYGISPVVFQNADWVFLSFESPDGFPTLQPAAG